MSSKNAKSSKNVVSRPVPVVTLRQLPYGAACRYNGQACTVTAKTGTNQGLFYTLRENASGQVHSMVPARELVT